MERKYARTCEDFRSLQEEGYFKPKSSSSGLANNLGVSQGLSSFNISQSDRKLSNENDLIMINNDEETPHFTVEHKGTAHFADEKEFDKYINGTAETDVGTPLETDGGNILVQRRKELAKKSILRKTIVKKKYGLKQLLASKRQLFLFRDGFLAYTEKSNESRIK